jgi:hypothetical protein
MFYLFSLYKLTCTNVQLLTVVQCRGSLFRLIHRPNNQLDERRRLRMALDVVCLSYFLLLCFIRIENFDILFSNTWSLSATGPWYELFTQLHPCHSSPRFEVSKSTCWQKLGREGDKLVHKQWHALDLATLVISRYITKLWLVLCLGLWFWSITHKA